MKNEKENISIDKISELLKKAPTDDGTLSSAIYDLNVFIGIAKGVNDISKGHGTPFDEFVREREEMYARDNRRFC